MTAAIAVEETVTDTWARLVAEGALPPVPGEPPLGGSDEKERAVLTAWRHGGGAR